MEANGGMVPSDENAARIANLEDAQNEMFRAMDGGWFQDWADRYLTEDVHLVVAGKMNDPSEDRACCGKVGFLTWYNNVIEKLHFGSATMEWKRLGDVQILSPETACFDWQIEFSRADDDRVVAFQRRYMLSTRDSLTYFLLTCAVRPEEDMNPLLLAVRSCMPPSSTVPIPPCTHNTWDSVRSKKKCTLLRCRACAIPWRLPSEQTHLFRCVEFVYDACPHPPASCRRMHVHLRKRRLHERKPYIARASPEGISADDNPQSEASKNAPSTVDPSR
ncbi:hypothetical protein DIPPA_19899 [Diplonema papillatum]|nr:hypothetical protein DIPPA_19899 [Diplonema papillatum]